ncbi:phage distal tail protein [Enterococcus olivae]
MEVTFNDEFSLSDFKMAILKDYERPLFSSLSNKTKNVPGRPGAWDFGVDIGARTETFPIVCMAVNPYERELLVRDFVGRLFDRRAQPKTFQIRTNYDPELWVECRVSAQPNGKYYRGGHVDFELQFTAYNDPFKRATQTAFDPKEPVRYGEVTPGDYYTNPESFEWMYNIHYYGCHNYGSLETDIIFTIANGTAKNPRILHLESGRELTLPDFTSATVEIDTGKKTIKVNGQSVVSGSNMKFFSLYPGDNGFAFKGDTVKGKVSSRWLHKFM